MTGHPGCESREPGHVSDGDHAGAPTILVLVLAYDRDPWRGIEISGQRATWVAAPQSSATVRFYYGTLKGWERAFIRHAPGVLRRLGLVRSRTSLLRWMGHRSVTRAVEIRGDRITTFVPESPFMIGAKTISALRYALETHSFDYVFRTNTSSYVNLEQLVNLAARLPDEKVYGGRVVRPRSGEPFISGAGILLSRDVAEALVHDEAFSYEKPDDVAIAGSLFRRGVSMTELGRVDVGGLEQVDSLANEVLCCSHHFRCKVGGARSADVDVMRRLHARVRSADCSSSAVEAFTVR